MLRSHLSKWIPPTGASSSGQDFGLGLATPTISERSSFGLVWPLMAVPVLTGWQYATLISPVFVTFLLMKMSGVPLLEQKADERWGDKKTEAYKKATPVLIPRPPRSVLHHRTEQVLVRLETCQLPLLNARVMITPRKPLRIMSRPLQNSYSHLASVGFPCWPRSLACHVTASRIVRRLDREGLLDPLLESQFNSARKGSPWPSDLVLVTSLFFHFASPRVSKKTAEIDAEGIEHHVSKETLLKMKEFI